MPNKKDYDYKEHIKDFMSRAEDFKVEKLVHAMHVARTHMKSLKKNSDN